MLFGLTNNPVTFQTIMNNIFQEIINKGVMVIYMDNILIFSGQTKEQHHTIVVQCIVSPQFWMGIPQAQMMTSLNICGIAFYDLWHPCYHTSLFTSV